MARSLHTQEAKMEDETQPITTDEHDHGTDQEYASDPAEVAAGKASIAAARRSPVRPKKPLISAIEIENFKGIGAPIRIDLRPITLLFGRNSAGKSTILQALCYAHEVLSHGNVDVRKTELGGDRVDLGGFRQFVHRHDANRVIRLSFELRLNDWNIPEPIWNAMVEHVHDPHDPFTTEGLEWLESNNPTSKIRSGRATLTIGGSSLGQKPALTSFEVDVNGTLVGRILASNLGPPKLELNWDHPLFEPFHGSERGSSPVAANQVAESSIGYFAVRRLLTTFLSGGQETPLPDWDSVLSLSKDGWELRPKTPDDEELKLFYLDLFVSGVLVGIGRSLRDELKRLRYLGPVRELLPHPGGAPDPHRKGHWSDGSAAWNVLAHHPPAVPGENDPIDAVNDWLARGDRLDAGYKLRRRSIVELPDDNTSVSAIRLHQEIFRNHLDDRGTANYDAWVSDLAAFIAKQAGTDPEPVELQLREGTRKLAKLATDIDKLQRGQPRSAVKALVRAIATAPDRKDLELVTATSGIRVRTSDIGVGISQILPVVVAALDPDRPGITAVEQPELHVHPRMQVELGDLFAAALGRPVAGFGALSDQPDRPAGIFLIETHSEHLILRLLRRIEETHSGELPEGKSALKPDQVSVVFLEQTDGEVRATRLRIDETGEFIDRWPQGFFEERSDELF